MNPAFSDVSLRFWHPVGPSVRFPGKPVAVKLCGVELVLFRQQSGKLAALADRCAHRRMRLSKGCVRGDRIVCPYHHWSFDSNGHGQSPGNPEFAPKVDAYETIEKYGYCWVRKRPGIGVVPDFDSPVFQALSSESHELVHTFEMDVDAPFQLLVDNMAELEHTISVHDKFGFRLADINQVITRTTVNGGRELEIYYEGPQRPLPALLTLFAGLRGGDRFIQYATLRFGPVHSCYELKWVPRGSDQPRPFGLRFVIFYNPVDDTRCHQVAFVYLSREFSGWRKALVLPILRRIVEAEIRADIRLVEALTADAQDSSQHELGRFDAPLIAARSLIRERYMSAGGAHGGAEHCVLDGSDGSHHRNSVLGRSDVL